MRKLRNPKAEGDLQRVLIDLYDYVAPMRTTITADYTTSNLAGLEIVVCNNTSPVTIDLTNKTKDLNRVRVVRANTGTVTLDGNGNTINGASTQSVASQYDSMTVEWLEDVEEWIII